MPTRASWPHPSSVLKSKHALGFNIVCDANFWSRSPLLSTEMRWPLEYRISSIIGARAWTVLRHNLIGAWRLFCRNSIEILKSLIGSGSPGCENDFTCLILLYLTRGEKQVRRFWYFSRISARLCIRKYPQTGKWRRYLNFLFPIYHSPGECFYVSVKKH